MPRSPGSECSQCLAERAEAAQATRHAQRMIKRLGLALLGVCLAAVVYGWVRARLEARRLIEARAALPVMVFEAPGDDSAWEAKRWFRDQGLHAEVKVVHPGDAEWAAAKKREPRLVLPAYIIGQSAFLDFTPELAARVVEAEARRSLGGNVDEPAGTDFIVSPASGVGAMAFALFGVVWVCFEIGLVARVVLGAMTVSLFVASFWITNAPVALGARALLVLLGVGALSFARLRGADLPG